MYSTHEAELDIPRLPLAARRVHIVPALQTASLLSMGQLCDAGCIVTFDAKIVTVHLDDELILTGARTPTTGLWHLNLVAPLDPHDMPVVDAPPSLHNSFAAVHSATPAELVAFAHAALFSPAISTLRRALINGYLPHFMGLTAQTLAKHPPNSVAMVKGHMDQTRQHKNSTKVKTAITPSLLPNDDDDAFPSSDPANIRTHNCFTAVFEPSAGQIHTDQTGRLIVASNSGNNYILVLYDYDSNSILVAPLRSRTGPCILAGYQVLHARLVAAGLRPKLQRLDNECSTALKQFMSAEDVDYQLVPPNLHRRNAAERAIRTFKNHFIAGLCGVDKNFPLHLWDKLLPQAEMTLNLLRGSRINPKLSAHAQMHGSFDFNRTPLAPPGIRVLVHIKPNERTTWSPHGEDGWYVGPALDSYRCYTVWMWDTRATRICDTLAWFPTKCPMPLASSTDLILAGIGDILHALRNPTPGSPLAPLTDSHYDALTQLTSILTSLAAPTRTLKGAPPTTPVTNPDLLEDVAATDPPLRVATTTPGPTSTPIPAIPLRVGILPPPPRSSPLSTRKV
ncbi:hypothetical protein MHU86_25841 [Fragilaria crotonensis]|nr:hypothetical protein MHU86_25841 [Fragilaria crotonensis]